MLKMNNNQVYISRADNQTEVVFGKSCLSTKHIKCKSIEAADYSLLHIQAKAIECTHCGEEESWPTSTEHMDVEGSSFPDSNLHLHHHHRHRHVQKLSKEVRCCCNHTFCSGK
jgi:hypothetical protein